MNKFLLFIVFLSGITFGTSAQTKPSTQLSIGGEFGFPVGQAASVYGSVVGASVKLELPVSQAPFYFTVTAGITDYLVKLTYAGSLNPATYVPVEAGGKYYFSKISYVEGDLGWSSNINNNYTAAKGAFIFAPVIGFSAPVYKKKTKIDIGLRYEGRVEKGGTVGQIAGRLAYRFGL
ncbi:hypothetical protein [Mucilaginibacter gotjawali]|uniref:Uncharacterized protein n=2 Tax=Mucilaginibacter gotjawali TaxID=1550579 RepID=A0A110B228_9SPHI|nr:hypothetical protein [Mucilaginibacter gotjawali]MBB3055615.1 hypothetical protein [Mucilaginibacter gotjawali]BAU53100.1 hypothetical protein MgSA37_01267 [Mucilaginibacter gotjawali]